MIFGGSRETRYSSLRILDVETVLAARLREVSDLPIRFPPADRRKLAHKLDAVQPYVEKVATFEFSHFLSPNPVWPAARNRYDRYGGFRTSRGAR